ncbi:MAG TPA: Gfo/Idh/MocA family oxidoreductase [Acidobacteriaceae bacterium]|nr:Gfo/Idh/MocA family oxidoreductase [Acidobacteriaceae bacterium]
MKFCLQGRFAMAGLVGVLLFASVSPGKAQNTAAPVRVAIVGLVHGHVAGFLPQLSSHPEIQLVGIEEPDMALAKRYGEKYHLDPKIFYTHIGTMLDRTHPQAILVYTAISDHRHAIEVAAAHHVDVIVEKPLTTSLADALAIRQTARAHHIQVLVNYETTWYASNREAYELLQQGKLGELRKVLVRDGHQGPKEIGVGPEFLGWLTDPKKNGAGALFDFGCYGVDLMTWMMHGETPLSVTAVTQTDKPNIYPHVDDDATIILRYSKVQAVVMGSWDWSFAVKDMEVYGTKGTAFTQGTNHLFVRYAENEPSLPVTAPPIPAPNDSSIHYLEAVLAGKLTPKGDLSALDTNVIVMQILDAARESARTGRTVTLKALPD